VAPAISKEAAPSIAPPISTHKCASCGRRGSGSGVKLKPCSRCKAVFYCGVDCQRRHWKEGHKLSCCSSKK
jgi:hypothetical protein